MKNFIATPTLNQSHSSMNDHTSKQTKKLDINLEKLGIEKNLPTDRNA